MRWAGQVANIRVKRNVYKILASNPECKRLFGKHGHMWEDNIKMGVNKISL
jgi:hypothetical protein